MVFARKLDDRLASLVQGIDGIVTKNKKKNIQGCVVFVGENVKSLEPKLVQLAKEKKLSIPLTVAADQPNGPRSFKIAKDAETTVMLYAEKKVKVNHALRAGELTKERIAQILESTTKLVPGIEIPRAEQTN